MLATSVNIEDNINNNIRRYTKDVVPYKALVSLGCGVKQKINVPTRVRKITKEIPRAQPFQSCGKCSNNGNVGIYTGKIVPLYRAELQRKIK